MFKRFIVPTVSFTAGYFCFATAYIEHSPEVNTKPIETQRSDILRQIKASKQYRDLINNEKFTVSKQSSTIPKDHQKYHVGQGLLYGPGHLEIDPVYFTGEKEVRVFYHLGKNLCAGDGNVHKGLLSMLLDEALCVCGFPYLPSGKGVTAKLQLDFHEPIKPDSTVLLSARVTSQRGRKAIIVGDLIDINSGKKLANAECILVEPKWFKYVSPFVQVF